MFRVFKTGNTVIAVSVHSDGKIFVYDSIRAKALPQIDSFEANGVSDFNHAMKSVIEKHGAEKLTSFKFVKQYDDDSCDEHESLVEVLPDGNFKIGEQVYRIECHPEEAAPVGHEFWATVPLEILRSLNTEFPDGCEVGEEEDEQEVITKVVVAYFFRI